MTRLYFDTEFTGLHKNTTLISLGIVAETGQTFYAEFSDYNRKDVNEWLTQNVISKLQFQDKITASCGSWEHWKSEHGEHGNALSFALKNKDMSHFECIGRTPMVRNRLEQWIAQFDKVQMWSDVLAYDWVLFCDIFGHAFNIPKNVHYIPMDLSAILHEMYGDADINREDFAGLASSPIANKHNALWDAHVIKQCHAKLLKIK